MKHIEIMVVNDGVWYTIYSSEGAKVIMTDDLSLAMAVFNNLP